MSKQYMPMVIKLMLLFFIMPISAYGQLEDPTRPPGYRSASSSASKLTTVRFFLSSIRISSIRRSAIVNDQSVETGDVVNGAEVIAIYPSSVKLKKQGRVFTVKLVPLVVKKIRIH